MRREALDRPFRDKVALVTGAASGIGRALCENLVRRGAMVAPADVNQEALAETCSRLSDAAGRGAAPALLDVTDRRAFEDLVRETVARHGRLDYLFNNAGIGVGGETHEYAYEDWSRVVDVNLYGVIHGVHAAYPVMVRQGFGHIVNVASLAGLIPLTGEISYTASKYAVVGLSHCLRAEGADRGVRVTVVCPGKIETSIYRTSRIVNFDRDKVLSLLPRGISPERCAEIILNGVARNRATVVVTGLARALWILQRISPAAAILLSRGYMRRMRACRVDPVEGGAG